MKLISCDWGTSRFRVNLMNSGDLEVVSSFSSDSGIKSVNAAWQQQSKLNRTDFFRYFLQEQLQVLAERSGQELSGLPVFISGMASSSIGMLELPYAKLPFSITGENLTYHKLSATMTYPHETYILSGLASNDDVMRGEETQVIGLQNTIRSKKALVILPGTHSKYIRIEEGKIRAFSTFMTGELFATTAKFTILSHSVKRTSIENKALLDAFRAGVDCLKSEGYLSALFKVRTRTLLHDEDDESNYAFLSGIHLGEELRHLANLDKDTEIIICTNPSLAYLYRLALQALHIQLNDYVVPGELSSLVTAYGHLALAQQLKVDENHPSS
ncbi:MAG: 2-dehydro-3-deoxygalactonokinase [Saprospiraceae bacterium]|nr:2-dehydro-3-deoxygalactonokinase [Saprospiraceae bacterium]